MAAPEYTTCVDRKDYRDPGLPRTDDDFLIKAKAFILQGGLDLLLKSCDYILHGKLVCLGGDRCAIGLVASFETVDDKSGIEKLDNDFSINLALNPFPLSGLKKGIGSRSDNHLSAVKKSKQGELLKEQSNMPAPKEVPKAGEPITETNRFAGNFVKIDRRFSLRLPINTDKDEETFYLPVLHAEIEGERSRVVCAAAAALWGPVHNTVCKIPLIGGFLCFIITVFTWPVTLVILAILLGAWAAGSDDNRDFDGGGDLEGDDLVMIRGRWVYDAGHIGWNEIHPVKHIQKIPRTLFDGLDFEDVYARWCENISRVPPGGPFPPPVHINATDGGSGPPKDLTPEQTETWNQQTKPENRWLFHPLVDGCQPSEKSPDKPDIK